MCIINDVNDFFSKRYQQRSSKKHLASIRDHALNEKVFFEVTVVALLKLVVFQVASHSLNSGSNQKRSFEDLDKKGTIILPAKITIILYHYTHSTRNLFNSFHLM